MKTAKVCQALFIFGLLWACKKSNNTLVTASLTVVNGVNTSNSDPILTNFQTIGPKGTFSTPLEYYTTANQITYGSYWESGSYTGMTDLTIFSFPDTTSSIWGGTLDLQPGSIHTLFLSGDSSSVDTLFTTDIIPYYPVSDSVLGIRFVNLSKGSNTISINLEGSSNGSEVTSLAYKGISSFKQYPNNSSTIDYLFVVRDATTGDSLTQFDFLNDGSNNYGYGLTDPKNGNLLTFKNITIAVYGSETNPNIPLSTMGVDDY